MAECGIFLESSLELENQSVRFFHCNAILINVRVQDQFIVIPKVVGSKEACRSDCFVLVIDDLINVVVELLDLTCCCLVVSASVKLLDEKCRKLNLSQVDFVFLLLLWGY